MNEYLLKFNSWQFFFILISFVTLIIFGINYLFVFDVLYYQSFGEKLASDRIAKMIEQSQKWEWLGYVFIPVIILIRVSFTTICLYIGFFLINLKVRFENLFKIALLSDFVFVLAGIAKLVILIFFKEVSVLEDLQFQPLSLMELFDRTTIDPLFVYPLSLVNVFELLYWLALAWLLAGVIEQSFGKSLKLVASSYGSGLLLWVLFVMFITVSLS
ncbi:MAG: hypothetical protein RBS73_01790 [Prolixibacteraceae bacterium]|jgi:hypothetical protein|nr:hypothetical protein [Prolixibacteraceae bacterium]